jgi:class 3 adenylate cyclase
VSADLTINYVTSGEAEIAYATLGDAPGHLVVLVDGFAPIDDYVTLPAADRFLGRLARLRTVVLVNLRGFGLSDPMTDAARYPEAHADDVVAVLDALEADRTDVLAVGWSGNVGIRLAAGHPDRVGSLVLCHAAARPVRSTDHPIGPTDAEYAALEEALATGVLSASDQIAVIAPSAVGDTEAVRWLDRAMRRGASPTTVRLGFEQGRRDDTRPLLGSVVAPVLVLHRESSLFSPIEGSRHLAEHLPHARLKVLPGSDHVMFFGEVEPLLAEIEEFLTGTRLGRDVERRLVTIMFSDLVDSTGQAVSMGDERWRDRLDLHDRTTASVVTSHGGRVIKNLGDGSLAVFDSPGAALRAADDLNRRLAARDLTARFSVHAGEVEVRGEDVGGVAVHLAARVLGAAAPGEVLVSAAVPPLLLGSGFEFAPRGPHVLKGLPGEWELYAVVSD